MADRPVRPCRGCDVVDDGPRVVIGHINVAPGFVPPPDWHPDCYARSRGEDTTNKENDHG